MTKPADEVFRLIVEHYAELYALVKTDADRDAFQDTVLWMATHTRASHDFVRKFRIRFRFIRIENHLSGVVPLTSEVPDNSEPYTEKTSDEHVEDIINELRDAILAEEEVQKPRPK